MSFEGAILWDLDGTLLTTARSGRLALAAAILEHTDRRVDLTGLTTAGLTDAESVGAALAAAGVSGNTELRRAIREGYEQRLPAALSLREGRVLPGVRDALAGLTRGGRIANVLLTGNTRAGAEAKLAHYGLAQWFTHGGGFCEGPGGRSLIARRALRVARDLVGRRSLDRILVVGDTPRDVECADGIGVRTVGVATGVFSIQELLAAGAVLAFDGVPDGSTLERLVLYREPS